MCMGGGGGGGFGGGGAGGGGGYGGGYGSGIEGIGGSGGSDIGLNDPVGGITTPTVSETVSESSSEFLGSTPGFSEDAMTVLANKKGKSQLYIK